MCSTLLTHELLPGIPNSVVLGNLLHRIPWYSRPVLRAVSKSWHAALTAFGGEFDVHAPDASSSLDGLLLIHHLAPPESTRDCKAKSSSLAHTTPFEEPLALSMYEEDSNQWRLLPPIADSVPSRLFHGCGVASSHGKVYVMGGYDASSKKLRKDVFMLDIRRGKWTWERCKPMRFERCEFACRAHQGKIYVVGGQSRKGEPDPEVYDTEKEEWEVLPRVLRQDNIEWAMATYSGIAIVKGWVIAHGYWESQTGNVIRFHRRYDEKERRWRRLCNNSRAANNKLQNERDCAYWGNWRATCSDVVEGVYDMRDGVLAKFNKDGRWEAMEEGRVCECAWWVVWEGGVYNVQLEEEEEEMGGAAAELVGAFGHQVVCTSIACVHRLVVSHHRKVAYATLCKGHPRFLSLWKGHIDHTSMNVKWTKLSCPMAASVCSGICLYDP